MWDPQRPTTLWASTACYRDSFTFFYIKLLLAKAQKWNNGEEWNHAASQHTLAVLWEVEIIQKWKLLIFVRLLSHQISWSVLNQLPTVRKQLHSASVSHLTERSQLNMTVCVTALIGRLPHFETVSWFSRNRNCWNKIGNLIQIYKSFGCIRTMWNLSAEFILTGHI
jgi:hypothetical protein